MKMHSYMTVNGHFQKITTQSQALLDDLRRATNSVGGWNQALKDARAHRAELDALHDLGSSSDGTPPSRTPDVPEGSSASFLDAHTAGVLRMRLTAVASQTDGNISSDMAKMSAAPVSYEGTHHLPPPDDRPTIEPHPLVDHPSEGIAAMAKDYSELQSELTSTGPARITWPNNISIKNFAVYQLIPTLVYELEYPRTDRYVIPLYCDDLVFSKSGYLSVSVHCMSLKRRCDLDMLLVVLDSDW